MISRLLKYKQVWFSFLLIICFILSGCSNQSAKSISENDEAFMNKYDYAILEANKFVDGYACLKISNGFVSVDKEGNALYFTCRHGDCDKCEDRNIDYYVCTINGYHYFRGIRGLDGERADIETIITVKYDGSEISRIHFLRLIRLFLLN